MTTDNVAASPHTAEIIAHLARLAYTDSNVRGLTAAQWTALRFFRRATLFSRTLSAFADYHATTRASASQTVKSLLARGLVARQINDRDKRSARIDLTEKGRILCEKDPLQDLVGAIASLPKIHQGNLNALLEDVLASLGGQKRKPNLGTCSNCRFLKEHFDCQEDEVGYFCRRAQMKLSSKQLHDICMKFRPVVAADNQVP